MQKVISNNLTPKKDEICIKDTYITVYCTIFVNKINNNHYVYDKNYNLLNNLILGQEKIKIKLTDNKIAEELLNEYDVYYYTSAYSYCADISKYLYKYYSGNVPLENTYCEKNQSLIKNITTLIVKQDNIYYYTYLLNQNDFLQYLTKNYTTVKKALQLISKGFIYYLAQNIESKSFRTESDYYTKPTEYKGFAYDYREGNSCLFGPKFGGNFIVDNLSDINIKGDAYIIEDKEWMQLKDNNFISLDKYYEKIVLKDINGKIIKVGDNVIIADKYYLMKGTVTKINNESINTTVKNKVFTDAIMII